MLNKCFLTSLVILNLLIGISVGNAQVKPSPEQVQWADAEMGVIIHLDINIFAPGTFDYASRKTLPSLDVFTPSKLNTDQWLKIAKSAGAKYAVLTVKHGTGFCLWPSKVNDYNVGHTKWRNGKADILKSFIASCKKYGIKPGLYYNTNSNTYYNAGYVPFVNDSAHMAYNKAVLAQLNEIWSNYGELFEIWFDGGINNDKKFGIEKEVMQMIRSKQAKAILFQGPVSSKNIIRWIGNEDGIAAYPQWSRTNLLTSSNGTQKIDELHGAPDGKIWSPGESDFPIRKNDAWNGGWLWKAGEDHKLFTITQLVDKYSKSIGRNTNMLVGMVVDTSGLIPKADSLVFDSLGKKINQLYGNTVFTAKNFTQNVREFTLPKPTEISRVVIQEDITKGENISSYLIEAQVDNKWETVAQGSSVGHKRIQLFKPTLTNKIRFTAKPFAGTVCSVKNLSFY